MRRNEPKPRRHFLEDRPRAVLRYWIEIATIRPCPLGSPLVYWGAPGNVGHRTSSNFEASALDMTDREGSTHCGGGSLTV